MGKREPKAYQVFLPGDDFCLLVFAMTIGKAKSHATTTQLDEFEFVNLRALRRPEMDCYAEGEKPYIVWSNDDLPPGVPSFYEENNA